MEFLKIAGSGNDFIVIDNRMGQVRGAGLLARRLCDRRLGIGADGLLLLCRSRAADFRMRIINADGSEAEMCGNGLRCLARFIREKQISRRRRLSIETLAGVYDVSVDPAAVRVKMRVAGEPRMGMTIALSSGSVTGHLINTGVPHFVIPVEDAGPVEVQRLGSEIRHHPAFGPQGTNVDWVEVVSPTRIRVRTYERGVEAETLSCGTGMTACAVICRLLGAVGSRVTVIPASGELIRVSFPDEPHAVFLEGGTRVLFSGVWLDT